MGDGAVGEPGSAPLGKSPAGIDELLCVAGWFGRAVVVVGAGAPLSAGVDIGSALAGSVERSDLAAGAVAAAQGGFAQALGAVWARACATLSSVRVAAPPARILIRIAVRSSTSIVARTTPAAPFGSTACHFCGAA
jgi:hypothetical protein